MEDPRITLANGKELVIRIAPFELGYKLTKAVNRIIQKNGVKFDESILNIDFSNFKVTPAFMVPLANMFLSAMEDDALDEIFWACANHCSYDGLRVNRQLFSDDIDARGVYYQIKLCVLRENLLPFFPSLRSWLTDTTKAES